ncbi:MAG: hypothetical protein ABIH66_06280 [bacterium]
MERLRRVKRVTFVFLAVFLLAAFSSLYLMQNSVFDNSKRIRSYGQTVYYLPPKEVLKVFSFGFDQAISDFFWIKALTYTEHDLLTGMFAEMGGVMAGKGRLARERERVFELIDMATFFDPKFVYAYEFGGSIFAWEGDVKLANAILMRGLENNPDAWRLAYAIGFNHYFFHRDYEEAIRYMRMASEMPGSLVRGTFVSQLYLMMNEKDTALKILYSFFEAARDPDSKRFYAERIRYFLVEKHLEQLNDAIEIYERKPGKTCLDLQELVRDGIIKRVPEEPFGGKYVIDYADFRAVNRPYKRYKPIAKFFDVKKEIDYYHPKYKP